MKSCARRCERACCVVATYFPVAFVYSLTSWAVWVEAGIGLSPPKAGNQISWTARSKSILGIILYILLNTCYTVAAFIDPGSPIQRPSSRQNATYSSLPTSEPSHEFPDVRTVTVSSTGQARYCKKCQTPKPDRTHHCSTCRRCVLKMDHHCPWLATCLGLHNYKAFVLFLVYTSVFCWICFLTSGMWIWTEIFADSQYLEEFAPVNIILLAVVSGIIGLVVTGFTAWHLYLCVRGQTTIECLEKTRYLSGVRRQVERQRQDQLRFQHGRRNSSSVADALQRAGEHILEFHANAVPGASRFEEGEERTSPTPPQQRPHTQLLTSHLTDTPAQQALRRTYSSMEEQRARDRYEEYLADKDSEKLPNAFDLGWRRNLAHLFGPRPLLWFLPVCNTTGDGWHWEISPKWIQANEEIAKRREQESHLSGSCPAMFDGPTDADVERGPNIVSMQTLKRPGQAWGKAPRQHHNVEDYFEGEESALSSEPAIGAGVNRSRDSSISSYDSGEQRGRD